jgi:hypothetical protein
MNNQDFNLYNNWLVMKYLKIIVSNKELVLFHSYHIFMILLLPKEINISKKLKM